MDQVFQRSTCTIENRHPRLLKALEVAIGRGPLRPKRILSFGCSRGEEVKTLLETYTECETVIGVDFDQPSVDSCTQRFAQNPKVEIMNSAAFAARKEVASFDLITCFNVLCTFPPTKNAACLPFDRFRSAVIELFGRLATSGTLLVFGANFDVRHVQIPGSEFLVLPRVGAGEVPHFDPGTLRIVDGPRQVTAVVKKALVQETAPRKVVTFGIMSYSLSSNIGDDTQTLAQINTLSAFYRREWHMPSESVRAAFEQFSACWPGSEEPWRCRARQSDVDVHVVWVDRDCTLDISDEEAKGRFPSLPVFVIANGWYAHKKPGAIVHQFPFASWLHPFLVSVHCATPDILERPGVRDYLRKFGPVGCRDTSTVRLVRDLGVPAFFSSCLTFTLLSADRSLGPQDRQGNCFEVDVRSMGRPAGIAKRHLDMGRKSQDPDARLAAALCVFNEYSRARSIISSRIHCVMPAKAAGVPCTSFTSPTFGNDASWIHRSRFSGLVECMYDGRKRNLLALALAARLHATLDALLVVGLNPEAVQEVFRGSAEHLPRLRYGTSPETLDLSQFSKLAPSWDDIRLRRPLVIRDSTGGVMDRCLDDCNMHYFVRRPVRGSLASFDFILGSAPIQSFHSNLNILVTFDSSFCMVASTFLSSLSWSNPESLCRVFCHTRGVSPQEFQSLRERTGKMPNVVLFQIPVNTSDPRYTNYKSPLGHVNVCCMDRLFLTEIDLPADVNRIIYLDLDILVLDDLRPLLEIDTGITGIAAKTSVARDVINHWISKYDGCEELRYPYKRSFNAGVFVADLNKLRSNGFWEKVSSQYAEFPINDQMLMNFYAEGKYAELDPRFNVFVGQDHGYIMKPGPLNSAACLHFVGSKKPWLCGIQDYPHEGSLWQLWYFFDGWGRKNEIVPDFIPQ